MTEFKFAQKMDGKTLRLVFEGSIDEDAKFPEVDSSQVDKMVVDLHGVRAINSVGIREWLMWIRNFSEKTEIIFERCTKSVVLQFNMVDGFLPRKASVASLYVPYFCDKCDYENSHLFEVGKDVVAGPKGVTVTFNAKAAAKCAQEPCEIELDVTEAKYFHFLKR